MNLECLGAIAKTILGDNNMYERHTYHWKSWSILAFLSDTGSSGRREIKDTKIIGIKCDSSDDDIFTFYPITDNSENK